LRYEPPWLWSGIALMLFSGAVVLGLLVRPRGRKREG
jgi:hypothetical protein